MKRGVESAFRESFWVEYIFHFQSLIHFLPHKLSHIRRRLIDLYPAGKWQRYKNIIKASLQCIFRTIERSLVVTLFHFNFLCDFSVFSTALREYRKPAPVKSLVNLSTFEATTFYPALIVLLSHSQFSNSHCHRTLLQRHSTQNKLQCENIFPWNFPFAVFRTFHEFFESFSLRSIFTAHD